MRKLIVLKYPKHMELDLEDDLQFRKLILWLEDQKICHYKIDLRQALRKTEAKSWPEAFQKYLQDLSYPFTQQDRPVVVDWLCGLAIRNMFKENIEKNQSCSGKATNEKRKNKASLESVNVDDQNISECIKRMAKSLNIPLHKDHGVTLEAVRVFVEQRLANHKDVSGDDENAPKKMKVSLSKQDLGFETGDNDLDNISRALRILHINELRQLQTDINRVIVSVQRLTADPKTDQRLGRVGRT